jgi:hypothetical protein
VAQTRSVEEAATIMRKAGIRLLIEAGVLSLPTYLSAVLVMRSGAVLPQSYFALLFIGCYVLWAAGMRDMNTWLRREYGVPYLTRFAIVGGALIPACAVLVGQTILHAVIFTSPRRMYLALRSFPIIGWFIPLFILPLAAVVVAVGELRAEAGGQVDVRAIAAEMAKTLTMAFAAALIFRFFWEGPAVGLAKLLVK